MDSAVSLSEKIGRAVGRENCEADAEKTAPYIVGGVGPSVVVWPGSEEELRCIIELARQEVKSVIPAGGMTKINIGLPPRGDFILACLTRLSGVVDYDSSNLTITARAGTRLNALQAILAKEGQFLPLDPPFGNESTLGGILASNSNGPFRLYHGGARDLALGARVLISDGRTLKCGSKTVKNVAGYDMVKLFVGSWGTLGVVCDATFRVSPLPEVRGALAAWFEELGDAAAAAEEVLRSRFSPLYLSIISPGIGAGDVAQGEDHLSVVIGAEGLEEAVRAHLCGAAAICAKSGAVGCAELYGDEEKAIRRKMEEYPEMLVNEAEGATLFRASVPISKVDDFLVGLGPIAAEEGLACEYVANPGLGSVAASMAICGDRGAARGASVLKRVRELARLCSGHICLEHAPESLKLMDGVWGEVGARELSLMKAIKAAMDPYDLFCPGRFAGAI